MTETVLDPRSAAGGLPIIAIDNIPIMFEDEGYDEMGDSLPHTFEIDTLSICIEQHLADQPRLQVFKNMNLHYHPLKREPYISPDVMVVEPFGQMPFDTSSYRIGEDGKGPLLTIEVLSKRTAQQGDLTLKPDVYKEIKVAEYILVDPLRRFMPDQLLLKRLQPDGKWRDEKDPDGGVTSALGFRLVYEDGLVVVINSKSGHRYTRPRETERTIAAIHERSDAQMREYQEELRIAAEVRKQIEEDKRRAEEHAKVLEAEIARLRSMLEPEQGK